MLRPHLAVLGADSRDVVVSAGGLIYDRVRQGWRVTVHLPPGADTRPVRILGADLDEAPPDMHLITALLSSTALCADDRAVRAEVDAARASTTTDVLLWGAIPEKNVDSSVTHRLSAAAVVFKSHALLAADLLADACATEDFHIAITLDAAG